MSAGGDASFFEKAKRSGWVTKQGGGWKSWKRRLFVLEGEGKHLYYFKKEGDPKSAAQGFINLESAGHIRAVDYRGKKNVFQIQTPSRTYYVSCKVCDLFLFFVFLFFFKNHFHTRQSIFSPSVLTLCLSQKQ